MSKYSKDINWRSMEDDTYMDFPNYLLLIKTDITFRIDLAKYINPMTCRLETAQEKVLFYQ
jgi:hypothetical protein